MNSILKYGGIVASVILVVFGVASIATGVSGRDRVRNDLAREQIVGTPDSPIAGQLVDSGSEAQSFARTIRRHTLEATEGKTYAQMPRFMGRNGTPTSDEKLAAVDPKSGKPVDNPARNIWVTSTALQTALNTAYFAESVATFAIAMGVALLLAGVGFLVLVLRLLERPSPRAQASARGADAAMAA